MAEKVKRLATDVVIAGSGPGGSTVAKELSRAGKKVILLEKGPYIQKVGSVMVLSKVMDRKPSLEKDSVVDQASCLGGGTLVFSGVADEPLHEMWHKHGIDITRETEEAKQDCRVTKTPEDLITPGVKRFQAAAQELGYPCEILDRFFDPAKCKLGCSKCVYGCPTGAKWTAVEFAKEAEKNGATVLTNVAVNDVIVENGIAGGVRARGHNGQEYEINAKLVVCSAGALGTARILQRSGIDAAGGWFVGDPVVTVKGYVKEGPAQKGAMIMGVGWHDRENGIMFANVTWGKAMTALVALMAPGRLKGLRNLLRYGKGMEVMVKVADELQGRVFPEEGKVSKVLTKRDLQRLDYGRDVAKRVLIKAGCDPDSIEYTPEVVMGHPGGTIGVGKLLDSNLETSIKNLYCCDTGVISDSLGIPPTLTIVALGKRLSQRLSAIA